MQQKKRRCLLYVRLYRDRGPKEEYRQVEVPAACSLSVGLIVPRDITCAIFCSKERKRERKTFFLFFSLFCLYLFLSLYLAHEIALRDRGISHEFPFAYRLVYRSCPPRRRRFSVIVAILRGSNSLRPNDDVTLVHDSPRRIISIASYSPFVQNEKRTSEGHVGQREQPSLTELLPLRSLHSREAVVCTHPGILPTQN